MATDLRVKQLNTLRKGTHHVKYQSFADRLSLINVDVHHRVAHVDDRLAGDDIASTHFAAALSSWSELNLTADFCAFHREVRSLSCATSLPLLLHNQTRTIDLIIEHLDKPDSLSLEPLVDLFGAIARDLRGEFYPDFPRVLLKLIDLIDPTRPKLLEFIFTTIAFLFKYLLRQLIDNADSLYVAVFHRCLAHNKPYVREFAAETFSYVLRKVRSRSRAQTFAAIVAFVPEDELPFLTEGLSSLFFHMFKGVGRAWHSCTEEALPALLNASAAALAPAATLMIEQLITRMCESTEVQYSAPIFGALLAHVKAAVPGDDEALHLLRLWAVHRRGSRIVDHVALVHLINEHMDRMASLSDSMKDDTMAIMSSVLLYTPVAQDVAAQLLQKAFRTVDHADLLVDLIRSLLAGGKGATDLGRAFPALLVQHTQRKASQVADFAFAAALLGAITPALHTLGTARLTLTRAHLAALGAILRGDLDDDETALISLHLLPFISVDCSGDVRACVQRCLTAPSSALLPAALAVITDCERQPFVPALLGRLQADATDENLLQSMLLIPADALPASATLFDLLVPNLASGRRSIRALSSAILAVYAPLPFAHDGECNIMQLMQEVNEMEPSLDTERTVARLIQSIGKLGLNKALPSLYLSAIVPFLVGVLRVKFRLYWPAAQRALADIVHQTAHYDRFEAALQRATGDASIIKHDNHQATRDLQHYSTDPQALLNLLLNTLVLHREDVINARGPRLVAMFKAFIAGEYDALYPQERVAVRPLLIKDAVGHIRKQLVNWLTVLGRIKSPIKVLSADDSAALAAFMVRMQSHAEPDIQKLALQCTFRLHAAASLAPYKDTLLALCDNTTFREQITLFSLSPSSDCIDPEHRPAVLPVIYRILLPKLSQQKTGGAGSAVKSTVSSRRNAALGFVCSVAQHELDDFIREALGARLIDQPLSTRVSAQTKYLDLLAPLLIHLGDRLSGLVVPVFASLSKLIAHHGAALDPAHHKLQQNDGDDEDVDDNDDDFKTGMVSRALLRRALHVTSRLAEVFPAAMASLPDDVLAPILVVVQQWSLQLAAQLSQARSGVLDLIVVMSAHAPLRPVLMQFPEMVLNAFALLGAPRVAADVVTHVLQCATNLADHNLLGADLLRPLLHNLQILLCAKLASKSVPSAALALLSRLTPMIVESGDLPDCTALLLLLVPFVRKTTTSDQRAVLQGIVSLVPFVSCADAQQAFIALHRLLLTSNDDPVRQLMCDLATAINLPEAPLLHHLNSFAVIKMESGLDYTRRAEAYVTITTWDDAVVSTSSPILCQVMFDLRRTDMGVRGQAAHALDRWLMVAAENPSDALMTLLDSLIFPQIRVNLTKIRDDQIRRATVESLCQMICAFPVKFEDMTDLVNAEDREVDVLRNLVHIQLHRRRRALARIRQLCQNGAISERCSSVILRPLLFHLVYAGTTIDSAMLDEAVRAFGVVAACQSWAQYKATLTQLVRAIHRQPLQEKTLLRATCAVVDEWRYEFEIGVSSKLAAVAVEDDDKMGEDIKHAIADVEEDDEEDAEEEDDLPDPNLQRRAAGEFLLQSVLPHLYSFLQDNGNIRVHVAMVIVKLLKRLPERELERRIPRLISLIMGKLTDKDQRERHTARGTLSEVGAALGPRYLRFIIAEMGHFLRDGFKMQVLGYAVHSLLERVVPVLAAGDIDHCLDVLLPLVHADLFGSAAEARAVSGIVRKTKEARHPQSFSTIEIIATNITFTHSIQKLLAPFQAELDGHVSAEHRATIRNVLTHIAAGLRHNSTALLHDLFVFAHETIKTHLDIILEQSTIRAPQVAPERGPAYGKITKLERVLVPAAPLRDMKSAPCTKSRVSQGDVLIEFALHLFERSMSEKVNSSTKLEAPRATVDADEDAAVDDEEASGVAVVDLEAIRALCDPFVPLLWRCAHERSSVAVMTLTMKAFSALLHIPHGLPSLQEYAPQFSVAMIDGVQKGSAVFASVCLRGLTALLRRCEAYEMDETHLLLLLQFVQQRIEDVESAVGALSLLKAILSRRLLSVSLYDLMERVASIVIEANDPIIARHAHQALLQYLLEYPLSPKRIEQHLRYWTSNMTSFPQPQGRLSAMRMIRSCVLKFPVSVLDRHAQLLFLPVVTRLVNETTKVARQYVAQLLQTILAQTSSPVCAQLLDYVLLWWSSDDSQLQCAAAHLATLVPARLLSVTLTRQWIQSSQHTLQLHKSILDQLLLDCTDDDDTNATMALISAQWPAL